MKDLFLFSGFVSYDHSWSFIFHVILTAIVCLLIARAATSSMQLVPRGVQNVAEAYLMGVMKMGRDTFGSEELARKYLPMVATVGLMVLIANVMGIIPGFHSPTADINYTLALAIIVFLYYNYEGIRSIFNAVSSGSVVRNRDVFSGRLLPDRLFFLSNT